MAYETLIVETTGPVALITLNRPSVLNALNARLAFELGTALDELEGTDAVRAIVLTGSEKTFAAGADIHEMSAQTFAGMYLQDFLNQGLARLTTCRKPVIAAVAGYALGGGCELAMMCDMIIAADNARFGQPESNLGILPGCGGTQRLTRAVGKSKAMDMCLTGRLMEATEALNSGLVSRVVPVENLREEALKVANIIADKGRLSVMMVKEAINSAFETTLSQGIHLERRLFQATFATDDQKEGMEAFLEKRQPAFKDS